MIGWNSKFLINVEKRFLGNPPGELLRLIISQVKFPSAEYDHEKFRSGEFSPIFKLPCFVFFLYNLYAFDFWTTGDCHYSRVEPDQNVAKTRHWKNIWECKQHLWKNLSKCRIKSSNWPKVLKNICYGIHFVAFSQPSALVAALSQGNNIGIWRLVGGMTENMLSHCDLFRERVVSRNNQNH